MIIIKMVKAIISPGLGYLEKREVEKMAATAGSR